LKPCANLFYFFCFLQNRDAPTDLNKLQRGGEPADPSADDNSMAHHRNVSLPCSIRRTSPMLFTKRDAQA
jgi:hypothetical protein